MNGRVLCSTQTKKSASALFLRYRRSCGSQDRIFASVFSHAEPFGDLPGLLRAAGQLLVTQVAGVLDLLFRLAGDLRKAKLGDQARSLLGVIGLLLLAVAFGAEGVIALGPLFPAVGLGAIPAVVGVFDEGLSALFGGR